MLTLQILVVLSLVVSLFSLYTNKKNDEQLEAQWMAIYYLMAFMQDEYRDFGEREVKLKSDYGEEIDP